MKILFRLPTGGNGLPASMHKNKVALSVKTWAKDHNVDESLIRFCLLYTSDAADEL